MKLSGGSSANSTAGQTSYKTVPALSSEGPDGPIPSRRSGHTATGLVDGPHKNKIAVYGGTFNTSHPEPLDESGRIWLFDLETLHWSRIDPADANAPHPGARTNHAAVAAPGTFPITCSTYIPEPD